MRPRDAGWFIQDHQFGKWWVRASKLRLKILNPRQFEAIQIHPEMGYLAKRSNIENRTALMGKYCHKSKLSTKKVQKSVWLSRDHENTHRSVQSYITNKDIFLFPKIWVNYLVSTHSLKCSDRGDLTLGGKYAIEYIDDEL